MCIRDRLLAELEHRGLALVDGGYRLHEVNGPDGQPLVLYTEDMLQLGILSGEISIGVKGGLVIKNAMGLPVGTMKELSASAVEKTRKTYGFEKAFTVEDKRGVKHTFFQKSDQRVRGFLGIGYKSPKTAEEATEMGLYEASDVIDTWEHVIESDFLGTGALGPRS